MSSSADVAFTWLRTCHVHRVFLSWAWVFQEIPGTWHHSPLLQLQRDAMRPATSVFTTKGGTATARAPRLSAVLLRRSAVLAECQRSSQWTGVPCLKERTILHECRRQTVYNIESRFLCLHILHYTKRCPYIYIYTVYIHLPQLNWFCATICQSPRSIFPKLSRWSGLQAAYHPVHPVAWSDRAIVHKQRRAHTYAAPLAHQLHMPG